MTAAAATTPLPPMEAELDGYAWLPRMIAKVRATLSGTAGDFRFGCPIDHTCMALLGVTPELVLELVARHRDDEGVLAELRSHDIPPARDAWFDAPALERELQRGRVRPAGACAGPGQGRAHAAGWRQPAPVRQ